MWDGHAFSTLLLVVALGLGIAPSLAAPLSATERVLTVTLGGETRRFTAAELLARPDAVSITVPEDVSYHRSMTYRAVPLLGLIEGAASAGLVDTIEARASDGFASLVPASLVKKGASGGAVAWIAIEDPAAPWPNLRGKDVSGGPFYLVWSIRSARTLAPNNGRSRSKRLPASTIRYAAGLNWRWIRRCRKVPPSGADKRLS